MSYKYDFKLYLNFISGDVIAIEKPYAGVVRDESFHYNCHYCFKLCLSGIPCPNCMVRIYYNTNSIYFIKPSSYCYLI